MSRKKSFLQRKSERGIAALAMVLAGLAMIATVFWVVNNTSVRYADNQARLVDQVGAYSVLQDLALMARRAYDLGRATGGVCPSVGDVTDRVVVDGTVYCFARGKGSCVRHPFETASLTEDPILPLICYDSSVPGTIRRAYIASYNPSEDSGNSILSVSLGGFIDKAHAQTRPKPWFPDVSAGPVYAIQPSDANLASRFAHRCGSSHPSGSGVPCVTISLCVRVGTTCTQANQVRQTFALD